MRIYVDARTEKFRIGMQGEENAVEVAFDISDWLHEHGTGGTAVLTARRCGEDETYTK